MRIGVNALYLIPGGVGGTEVYLRSLLTALARVDTANEYCIFTNSETGCDLPRADHFRIVETGVRASFRPGRILYEQLRLPFLERVDVMFNPGFTAPVAHSNNVTVFHDLQHKRHPEHFRWFDLPAWNLLLWGSAKRSRRLIAVSEATQKDLRQYYGRESTVVPHGVSPDFFELASRRDPQDFFLCVSTLHPHKNLARLVRAFAAFAESNPGLRLVLAGMRGFFADEVEREIAALGLQNKITLTGWIPREQLLELYRTCRAVVYPSTFEGFGMPVLEAMAAGAPLACSNIEPLRALAEGTAILFDPQDERAIRRALDQILNEPAGRGLDRARTFTWENTARATLRVLLG